jgi:hypothetical protein
VPVPVAEEQIHEPRAQERAGVDALVGRRAQPLQELVPADDLGRSGEARPPLRGGARVFLDHPQRAREVAAELAERFVVGHDDEERLDVEHAGRLDNGAARRFRRVQRRDLVLHDVSEIVGLRSGARARVASFSTLRNVHERPSAPKNARFRPCPRRERVWREASASARGPGLHRNGRDQRSR